VSDAVNVYGEFIYGRSVADSLSVPYFTMAPNGTPLTIKRTNAYLNSVASLAPIAAAMDSNKLATISLGRLNMDIGEAAPHNERQLYRYLVGADFDLGGTWKGEIYYEHALAKVLNEVRNDQLRSRFANAVDSVLVNGSPVCAINADANPANDDPACTPFNPFGPQNVTAAQRAYLVGTARQRISLTEDVASASLTGDLFALPAGTVTLATGAEYRRENHVADADFQSNRNTTDTGAGTGNWWVGNYKPSSGGYNVKEGFGELLVPVLKDSAIGRSLDLNGAVRVTDYSTSGTVTTWKAGLTWDVVDGFRLRAVRSRDIRAPNLADYFLGGSSASQNINDGAKGTNSAQIITVGNPNLLPEVASTLTLGAVVQPRMLPGFSLSVDYYHIKIRDAISTPTAQDIADGCRNGTIANACSLITRDANGIITVLQRAPLNYKSEEIEGVDIEAGYRFALGNGNVSIRSLWSYIGKRSLTGLGVVDSQLGEVSQGGPVKLRGFTSVQFDNDRVGLSVRHRFIGQGVIDASWTAADINNNTVPAISYIDLSATGKFKVGGVAFELFGSIDNLFNVSPPRAPAIQGTTNTTLGTAGGVYDTIGRYFRAGLRFKM